MSGARNWKWMVPGALFGLFLLITRSLLTSNIEWMRWLALVPGMVMAICAVATIGNFHDYRREQSITFLERQRNALSRTALTERITAARGVNPEIVKILINEERRVWMLKSGVSSDGPHSVLYGAPDVTDFFLQYFLEGSTDEVVMPKRVLVDGRKNRFDPWGVVDEYTMYDRLIELLAKQGKIQRWSEFNHWEWVEPWTPQLVADDFGIEIRQEHEEDMNKNKIQ